MAKYANNNIFGDDQLHPNATLPPKHTVEIPTDWIADPNLKSHDKCILILMLCYATPSLDVQISRNHIRKTLGIHFLAIKSAMKRLTKQKYIRKLPTANGFIPIFRLTINPVVKPRKSKKSKI
jgi:hypothetical protein